MLAPDQLVLTAKSCGFLKRQRKANPGSFINSLMFHAFDKKEVSLNDHVIDMGKLAHNMNKNSTSYSDKKVIIGTKRPVEVRIIITQVPDQVKQERIRKTNKQNKSYGNQAHY